MDNDVARAGYPLEIDAESGDARLAGRPLALWKREVYTLELMRLGVPVSDARLAELLGCEPEELAGALRHLEDELQDRNWWIRIRADHGTHQMVVRQGGFFTSAGFLATVELTVNPGLRFVQAGKVELAGVAPDEVDLAVCHVRARLDPVPDTTVMETIGIAEVAELRKLERRLATRFADAGGWSARFLLGEEGARLVVAEPVHLGASGVVRRGSEIVVEDRATDLSPVELAVFLALEPTLARPPIPWFAVRRRASCGPEELQAAIESLNAKFAMRSWLRIESYDGIGPDKQVGYAFRDEPGRGKGPVDWRYSPMPPLSAELRVWTDAQYGLFAFIGQCELRWLEREERRRVEAALARPGDPRLLALLRGTCLRRVKHEVAERNRRAPEGRLSSAMALIDDLLALYADDTARSETDTALRDRAVCSAVAAAALRERIVALGQIEGRHDEVYAELYEELTRSAEDVRGAVDELDRRAELRAAQATWARTRQQVIGAIREHAEPSAELTAFIDALGRIAVDEDTPLRSPLEGWDPVSGFRGRTGQEGGTV